MSACDLTLLSLGFFDPCKTGGGVNFARGQFIKYKTTTTNGDDLKLIPHIPWPFTDRYTFKGGGGHVTTCCYDVINKANRGTYFSVQEIPLIFFLCVGMLILGGNNLKQLKIMRLDQNR